MERSRNYMRKHNKQLNKTVKPTSKTAKQDVQSCSAKDEQQTREVDFVSTAARNDFYEVPPRDVVVAFILQLQERIAHGFAPTIPIDHLGDGLIELKVNGHPAFRCVYTMKRPGKVLVLHTFAKTTNGPDVKNLRLARTRAKSLN